MAKSGKIRRRRRTRRSRTVTQNRSANFFGQKIQRKCDQCEEEEKGVMKKAQDGKGAAQSSFFSGYMNQLDSKGKSMDAATRGFFERKMGAGLSNVRLHTDDEATMAARAVSAKAFTYGNHIVFNKQYFDTSTPEGMSLLAHELVHVRQQRDQPACIRRQAEDEAPAKSAEGGDSAVANEMEAEQEEADFLPQPLPDFSTFGQPIERSVFGKSISIKGETKAKYDGGTGQTQGLVAVPSKDCPACGGKECISVTGKLIITYNVQTSVILPEVPEGLTECQVERVKDAIDNKIAPHEDEHVAAFSKYNGTAVVPINFTGCKADLAAYVQGLHDQDASTRQQAVQANSDALDPFHVMIDLDCEDPPEK